VVRREHIGSLSNHIGFAHTPEWYIPLVSEYDQRAVHGGQFLVKLRTAYSERVMEEGCLIQSGRAISYRR